MALKIVRQRAEAATFGVLLAGSAFLYWQTFSFAPSVVRGYPGAAFFPRLILYLVVAAAGAACVLALRARGRRQDGASEEDVFDFGVVDYLTTIAAIALFILALPLLGFEITAAGLLFVLLSTRLETWARAAAVSLVTVVVLYILFVLLLNVALPLLFLPRFWPF